MLVKYYTLNIKKYLIITVYYYLKMCTFSSSQTNNIKKNSNCLTNSLTITD